jgi:fructokinase
MLQKLMKKADFIKFNEEELFEVARMLGSTFNSLEQNLKFISEKTNTKSICITKGSQGAVLLFEDKLYDNTGYQIKVKDTVGAGDSFQAALIAKLLTGEHPQKGLDYACTVVALVAGSEGANPMLGAEQINKFIFPSEKDIY